MTPEAGAGVLAGRRPELAEAVGVFALVFGGCGAIVARARTGSPSGLGVALAFGIAIAVFVYAVGHVSGAHFNPAISLGFAATGHFPWSRVPSYVAAQLAGAGAAAGLLRALFGTAGQLGATTLARGLPAWKGVVIEAVATFFLAFVIVAVATDERAPAPAAGGAIGLAVVLGAIFAGPLTGGSMNPARTLGPALAAGAWDHMWVYIVGPVAGSLAAMGTYEALRAGDLPVERRRPFEAPVDAEAGAGEVPP